MNQDVRFYPGGGTAGHYRIESGAGAGSVCFAANTRPGLLHRAAVKFVLGWDWVDDQQPGSGVSQPTFNGKTLEAIA